MTQPPNPGQWGPPPGGGYGPPQQGYGPPQGGGGGYGYGPPPKKKHTARNVILGVIGVLILIGIISSAASGGGSSSTTAKKETNSTNTGSGNSGKTTSSDDHSEDVQIVSCKKDDETGFPTASVKVTNNSSKSSNYVITVSFNDGSTQIDTAIATVSNLNPGSSTTQDASSLKTDAPSQFTCKVEDTTRYSAVG